jgi:site-specific DNA recombinase
VSMRSILSLSTVIAVSSARPSNRNSTCAKHGVRVVSVTQPVGDETEPVHAMMRKVIALFDEYQSKENAKHVIRSMKENARQGFWNGATPPLGYKLIEAEKRGTKIKKKLDIDPVEAETVRLIFKLYLCGDGSSGALGVKEIVKWLNARGYRTRRSKSFGVGQAHKLLTNSIYLGRWKFNQASSKTRKRKAENEIVEIPVPHIVETDTFEQVRRQLHARSPRDGLRVSRQAQFCLRDWRCVQPVAVA